MVLHVASCLSHVKSLIFGRMCRSSHQRCSLRKGVLRNLAEVTGKHLCQSLFFIKVAGLSCGFCEILRTPFLQNTSGRLSLNVEMGIKN